ncbi:MAG TPA: acetylxylan esterase [Candidatus Paceibacterota bacterium]|nr:acetylxylan esterase [Verrucomicrobiota bacterium]HRY46473.1 acetylxylan esterase [Candidatus Paceibacterota bacterium]
MNRRLFLKTTVMAAMGSPGMIGTWTGRAGAVSPGSDRVCSRWVPSVSIRDYLAREAGRMTETALSDYQSASAWRRLVSKRRRQFLEMMGLDQLASLNPRPPLNVRVTGGVDRSSYRIENLYFESLPGLYVTANLYVPRQIDGRVPGVLYVCGHAERQKTHYQAHPRRFAELGFVCLIVDTIQLGEAPGYHHGCYREGWWHWYSRGYSPAGVELWNGIRALDLLAARPEVNPERLGVTGISGGGAVSWYVGAGDERVRVTAPVCGTATLSSHIHDRTIDGHCDCMWWINTYRWDLADVGALIAPRPLLIASADRDGIFTIESIRKVHGQLAGLYRRLGASEHLRLVETPGGHSYHSRSRTEIFSWFLRHLAGRDVPASRVGDIDDRPERQESIETLRVYVNGAPSGNRIPTIQDDFVPLARPVPIADEAAWRQQRAEVVAKLSMQTFGAFPRKPPPLDLQIEYEFDEGTILGHRFGFTSEEGWRLQGRLWRSKEGQIHRPAVVGLCLPREGRGETRSFLFGIRMPWARIEIAPRGTGDTAWSEDLNWHIRRSLAWMGRTLASMRVWDTLRALQAVRRLPGIIRDQIYLAAQGEMCVVALYAALLDGGVRGVFLEGPPGTLNVPGEKDGRGPAIELLNALRIADVDQVAGYLWPGELVLEGAATGTYSWAEETYRKLGSPGRLARVKALGDWRPS